MPDEKHEKEQIFDNEQVVEAVVVQIAKLDLLPGDILVMFAPEDWSPRQIAMFAVYLEKCSSVQLNGTKIMLLPHGSDLSIIRHAGFGPLEDPQKP